MRYILGVDAGATKTTAAVADENGTVLGVAEGERANMHVSGDREIIQNIRDVVASAQEQTGQTITSFEAAVIGIAGNDAAEDQKRAERLVADVVTVEERENVVVVNDTVLVRPSCSDKRAGISAVLGTGSNFYGVNEDGEEAWAGGLDWRLSDEASAYWIGDRALRAVVRAGDGRGEKTKLSDLVLSYFHVDSYRDLANVVYEPGFGKTEVAALAPLVDQAYKAGDKVAKNILQHAASDAAEAINTVIERLDMQHDELDIVAVGGQLRSPYPFREKIMEKIEAKKTEFVVCEKDPVHGAVKLAQDLI